MIERPLPRNDEREHERIPLKPPACVSMPLRPGRGFRAGAPELPVLPRARSQEIGGRTMPAAMTQTNETLTKAIQYVIVLQARI